MPNDTTLILQCRVPFQRGQSLVQAGHRFENGRCIWCNAERAQAATPACCEQFLKAMEWRTDNEGYSPLISRRDGEWQTGNNLLPLSFCPWCGKELQNV